MPSSIKKVLKNILFYFFILILFVINFAILNNFGGDNYYNYGFAYNIATGMIPYRDFNMVLFPFCSFLLALFMKIFGTKLIVYYVASSLIATLTIFIIRKMDKSVSIIVLLVMLLFPTGGYNYLSLLLLFTIIYLEKKKANDFLIGLILGITIMTNQKMILLLLPTFFIKDYKKILSRMKGILIPAQIVLMYLYINNALYYFLDYTVFGLFDFGNDNHNFTIYLWVELIMTINLLYKYLKTKDSTFLYCLCFQIISVPIFDLYHTTLGIIAFVFCTCSSRRKMSIFVNFFFTVLILFTMTNKFIFILNEDNIYLELNRKDNYYLTVGAKSIDEINDVIIKYYYSHIKEKDIYFMFGDMYYYKLKNSIPINKFDLTAKGNNGYNGTQKLKNEIEKMQNTLFIVYEVENKHVIFDQTNYELMEFITNNYERVDYLGKNFYVYEIDN